MSVVIGEVVSETAEAPPPVRGERGGADAGGTGEDGFDLDRADFEEARRRHRLQRLWAD